MRIAFVSPYEQHPLDYQWGCWRTGTDGLSSALLLLAADGYDLKFFRGDNHAELVEEVYQWKPDVVAVWDSFLGIWGPLARPRIPRARFVLFFGGGPIRRDDTWDLVFYESVLDGVEIQADGMRGVRAFGTNTDLFRPMKKPKVWDAIYPAAYASWKRQIDFAREYKKKGLLIGHVEEPNIKDECEKFGVMCLPWVPPWTLVEMINSSKWVHIYADKNGGCQRSVLEALACDLPVTVPEDAPKLLELVMEYEASGLTGRAFVESRYTARHYADAIRDGLCE